MKTKMKLLAVLKMWIVIYPSITMFLYMFGQPLSVLPLYQRTFLLTVVLVPWMMFVGVPLFDSMVCKIIHSKSRSHAAGARVGQSLKKMFMA